MKADERDIKESIDILETVAKKFESGEYVWGKGNYRNSEGKMCMMGAIYFESRARESNGADRFDSTNLKVEATDILWKTFRETKPKNGLSLTGITLTMWNDDPSRRKRDVIRLLRKAVKDAKATQA